MNQSRIKVVLFTEVNSKFGFPFLKELLAKPEISVEALVTSQEGKLCSYYQGEPDPVSLVDEAHLQGIPLLRSPVNSVETIKSLGQLQPDYFLIANYQQILKEEILWIPKEGAINFHPSPLPRYAGLAPYFWMAKQGELRGGVSCIQVTPQIDAGPLVAQIPVNMSGNETAIEIRNLHFDKSISLLKDVMSMMVNREMDPKPQDISQRSYFGRPMEKDYLIDWDEDVESILQTIRAGYPRPGAFTFNKEEKKLTILSAEKGKVSPLTEHSTGSVCFINGEIFVSAKNGWIRITSIKLNEREYPVQTIDDLTLFGMKLSSMVPTS